MMQSLTLSHFSWAQAQTQASEIRTKVFIDEQQVSRTDEWDGNDEHATHFLIHTGAGIAVATARVIIERVNLRPAFHIGRVAVLKDFRNQGIGHYLITELIDWCLDQKPNPGTPNTNKANPRIYLHAQVDRRAFYEQLGFVIEGDEFMDAGIKHISMTFRQNLPK